MRLPPHRRRHGELPLGTVQPERNGFLATNVSTTLAGYDRRDPAVVALIAAIDVVTQQEAGVTSSSTGNRLVLSVADYLITCTKVGTVGVQPTPDLPPTRTDIHS
jgi:hypothetical protein